jgi:cobalt-zinc-cadmium efflux system outer membrane protein
MIGERFNTATTAGRKGAPSQLYPAFALRFGSGVALPICIIVSSCTQFREYQPERISAVTQAEVLDSRTLDDPRLEMFIAANAGAAAAAGASNWDLGRLTLAALYYHPDIELARSKLQSANASVVTAAQIPNPTASADLTISPLTISPAINFLIETFGRREYRTAQAQAMADAAREDVATAAWQVRGRVRTALLNLWAAQRRSEYLVQRSSLQDQLVQLLERRLTEGEASALDVTRERINRNQFSLALRDAERQSGDARAQLATAIGVPLQALENKTFSLDAFESAQFPEMLSELRRQALTSRRDVQALLAQYRAAESAVQLEIAKQYPNVSLGPGYTYEPGTNQYEFTLATAADLPLFNRNQGPIAEAEARRRGIATQLIALQTQTIGAIDAAITSYRAASAAVETADSLLAESRQRNDQITRSFQAGDTDRPTLVAAGIELSTAEVSRFDSGVQQRQAIGALEDALQRELFEPLATFSVPEVNASPTTESMP